MFLSKNYKVFHVVSCISAFTFRYFWKHLFFFSNDFCPSTVPLWLSGVTAPSVGICRCVLGAGSELVSSHG